MSMEENARIFSSLTTLSASKGMLVVLTAYADSCGRLDFETFSLDRSSKHRQTEPQKSAKNCPILEKAYMFKEELQLGGVLRGRVWFAFWSKVISTVPGSEF